MEDIRIYDYDPDNSPCPLLLHIEHDIISSNWTLKYNDIGTWEGHFCLQSEMIPKVIDKKYLLVVQDQKQAIVTGKQADDEFILFGRTVNWLLSKRTVPEFSAESLKEKSEIAQKDVESIARFAVNAAWGDVIVLGDKVGLTNEFDVSRESRSKADEVIKSVLELEHAGHEVVYDIAQNRFIFRVTTGKPLSLIVSEANKNACESMYAENAQDYFTGGYFEMRMNDCGVWDVLTNTVTQGDQRFSLTDKIPSNYGKACRVKNSGYQFGKYFTDGQYIVCRDKSGEFTPSDNNDPFTVLIESAVSGIKKWECTLSGKCESEAKSDLAQKQWEKKVTAKTRGLLFGRDYHLGDTVTLQIEKGGFAKSEICRITGVNLWYENNNTGEEPVFEEDTYGI